MSGAEYVDSPQYAIDKQAKFMGRNNDGKDAIILKEKENYF